MKKVLLNKNMIKENKKKIALGKIKQFLAKNNLCYILITCKNPSKKGDMQVDMMYEGEDTLATYLLENAHTVFQNKDCRLNDL